MAEYNQWFTLVLSLQPIVTILIVAFSHPTACPGKTLCRALAPHCKAQTTSELQVVAILNRHIDAVLNNSLSFIINDDHLLITYGVVDSAYKVVSHHCALLGYIESPLCTPWLH